MSGIGQFLNGFGTLGDKIGKGEFGGNMYRLHGDCPWPEELHHLHRWGNTLYLGFWVAHLRLLVMYLDIRKIRARPPYLLCNTGRASGFEEETVEPICDADANPKSQARRIGEGLNEGFRVL